MIGIGRVNEGHPMSDGNVPVLSRETTSSRRELLLFLILAVVIWPFVAVGVVAGWGFVVWMYYILTGPPGPV
jgi:periplasmic nitrate reductase NapE